MKHHSLHYGRTKEIDKNHQHIWKNRSSPEGPKPLSGFPPGAAAEALAAQGGAGKEAVVSGRAPAEGAGEDVGRKEQALGESGRERKRPPGVIALDGWFSGGSRAQHLSFAADRQRQRQQSGGGFHRHSRGRGLGAGVFWPPVPDSGWGNPDFSGKRREKTEKIAGKVLEM